MPLKQRTSHSRSAYWSLTMPGEHTVYIRNLNEKLSVSSLKKNLSALFNDAGFRVYGIQACKNIRLRGQAFVSFADNVDIHLVVETFNTKVLCGKPMNVRVAKADSDPVVEETLTTEKYKQYLKKQRDARLFRRQQNKEKLISKKRKIDESENTGAESSSKRIKNQDKPVPNHVLIITGLPKETHQQELVDIFTKFAGFLTVNLVMIRQLALVEFQTEENAVECVNQLGETINIKDQNCNLAFAKK